MSILINIIIFLAGMAVGGGIVYQMEKKQLDELVERCRDTNEKLAEMIKQEEDFMESIWPKNRHNVSMDGNFADYLKDKYLAKETEASRGAVCSEDRDWSDCEDESDNLYV